MLHAWRADTLAARNSACLEISMAHKIKLTTALVSMTAALALSCGAAYAAGAAAPMDASDAHGQQGDHHWGHGGGHHHHGGFEMQMEKLHGMLNLTPQQETLWKTAVDTTHADRAQARTQHEAQMGQMKSAMQLPILDLAAMHTAHEQQAEQDHQLREHTTQAWLNVYASLNDQQKTIVSTVMKVRWQEFAHRHDEMHKHMHMHMNWEKHQPNGASAVQQ
jgi:periplasmic protein CpxP/Spy